MWRPDVLRRANVAPWSGMARLPESDAALVFLTFPMLS